MNLPGIFIDIQPYRTTQAQERHDIINVGGFSDQIFNLIAEVAAGARTKLKQLYPHI